jgi:hypothetical protein
MASLYMLKAFVESKLFLGVMIILMNIGSKYVAQDVPPAINSVVQHWAVKVLVLFSILFVSIRDLEISLLLTLITILLFRHLFHPESPFCVLPEHVINLDTNNDGKISPQELRQAQALLTALSQKRSPQSPQSIGR